MTPEQIAEELRLAGRVWADEKHGSDALRETRKSVRAQYAVEYMDKGASVTKAELLAESDPRYVEHIKAMVDRSRKENIARVDYDVLRVKSDHMRGQAATARVELQNLSGLGGMSVKGFR